MQKHALLTLLGLVLAALVVAWIQPNTNGGTTFVVVISVLLTNAVGAVVVRPRKQQRDVPNARLATAAAPAATKQRNVSKIRIATAATPVAPKKKVTDK